MEYRDRMNGNEAIIPKNIKQDLADYDLEVVKDYIDDTPVFVLQTFEDRSVGIYPYEFVTYAPSVGEHVIESGLGEFMEDMESDDPEYFGQISIDFPKIVDKLAKNFKTKEVKKFSIPYK